MADAAPEPDHAPTAKQLLHWATGDRKAEAEALADASGPGIDADDAELAVKRAHGDLGVDEGAPADEDDIADAADAEEAAAER